MGAFLITYPHDRIRTILLIFVFVRITFIPAALLICFWFLTQLINAGEVAKAQTGGVAYLAHIGGFLFGAVTSRLFESRASSQPTF
jgi:membrane associated rhomboid family serine protease